MQPVPSLVTGSIAWFGIVRSIVMGCANFLGGGLMLAIGMLMIASGPRPSRCRTISLLVISVVAIVIEIVPNGFLLIVAFAVRSAFLKEESEEEATYFKTIEVLFTLLSILSFALFLTTIVLSSISLCSKTHTYQGKLSSHAVTMHIWIIAGMIISQGSAQQSQLPGHPTQLESIAMNCVVDPYDIPSVPPPRYSS